MPIVYIHGVNNRKESESFIANQKLTRQLLKRYLRGADINSKPLKDMDNITFPYWGDLATKFAWDMASLPQDDIEALGNRTSGDVRGFVAALQDGNVDGLSDQPLLTLAKRDFSAGVELFTSLLIEHSTEETHETVVDFSMAAQEYAVANRAPAWLENTTTDELFIVRLTQAVDEDPDIESLGLGDISNVASSALDVLKKGIRGAVGGALDRVGAFYSSKLVAYAREPLNANLGRFFGDVFIYFDSRGDRQEPGPIPERVLAAIEHADQNRADEPLVIIGHSLGAVIAFDLISHYRPDLEVDLFVSVGSQVAHFEEMKLYHTSDKAIRRGAKAPTPDNIRRWINVFDHVDIFSYTCGSVFDRVDVDAEYDTKTNVIKAHGEYFKQARFYKKLRSRIDEL